MATGVVATASEVTVYPIHAEVTTQTDAVAAVAAVDAAADVDAAVEAGADAASDTAATVPAPAPAPGLEPGLEPEHEPGPGPGSEPEMAPEIAPVVDAAAAFAGPSEDAGSWPPGAFRSLALAYCRLLQSYPHTEDPWVHHPQDTQHY